MTSLHRPPGSAPSRGHGHSVRNAEHPTRCAPRPVLDPTRSHHAHQEVCVYGALRLCLKREWHTTPVETRKDLQLTAIITAQPRLRDLRGALMLLRLVAMATRPLDRFRGPWTPCRGRLEGWVALGSHATLRAFLWALRRVRNKRQSAGYVAHLGGDLR